MALFELAIVQQSQLLEQLPNQRGPFIRNRHIVRGPGIRRYFVLSPSRIAAGLRGHFEQREIVEAGLIEPPCRAQACHSSAHDHQRNLDLALGCRKRRAIPQTMSERMRFIYERSGDRAIGFRGEADQSRAEEPAARGQCAISLHSRSSYGTSIWSLRRLGPTSPGTLWLG